MEEDSKRDCRTEQQFGATKDHRARIDSTEKYLKNMQIGSYKLATCTKSFIYVSMLFSLILF